MLFKTGIDDPILTRFGLYYQATIFAKMSCLMVKLRIPFIVFASALAFSSLSPHMALGETTSSNYSKIMISFLGEDTNSSFENIYQFNKTGKLVNIIQIWNGGCCQAPVIEEFYRVGKRFKRSRSYTLEIEKPDNFPKVILCDRSIVRVKIEPTHSAVEGYSVAEIEEDYILEEPVPFDGCL